MTIISELSKRKYKGMRMLNHKTDKHEDFILLSEAITIVLKGRDDFRKILCIHYDYAPRKLCNCVGCRNIDEIIGNKEG